MGLERQTFVYSLDDMGVFAREVVWRDRHGVGGVVVRVAGGIEIWGRPGVGRRRKRN